MGYFCEDSISWTVQINKCINDPINRQILSKNAKSLYKKEFNSDLVYGKFVNFIERKYSPYQKLAN